MDEKQTDKIVELNKAETEQVVGGKHVNVLPPPHNPPVVSPPRHDGYAAKK